MWVSFCLLHCSVGASLSYLGMQRERERERAMLPSFTFHGCSTHGKRWGGDCGNLFPEVLFVKYLGTKISLRETARGHGHYFTIFTSSMSS